MIFEEYDGSRYSIYPGATNMKRDHREVYWFHGLESNAEDFVSKFPHCAKVKDEKFKSSGLIKKQVFLH